MNKYVSTFLKRTSPASSAASSPARATPSPERPEKERRGFADLLLGNPRFASLWIGQTLSRLGNYVYGAGIGVLTYRLTGSGGAVGLVLGAFSVAQISLVIFGGVAADRVSRRRLIVVTDAVAFVLMSLLGLECAIGDPPLWHLVVASVLLGALAAVHLPAYRSVIPEVVPERHLNTASALSSAVNSVTTVAGPGIGAWLVAVGGGGLCLLVNAGTFAVAVACMLPALRGGGGEARHGERPARAAGGVMADVRGGLRAIRAVPELLRSIAVGAVVVTLVDAPLAVLLPVLAERPNWGPWVVGATFGAVGVGTVVSSLLTARLSGDRSEGVYLLFFALAGLPLCLGVLFPSPLAWLVCAAVYGGFAGARYIRQALIQRVGPPESLGRIFSVDSFAMLALTPLSCFVAGVAVTWAAPSTLLTVGALANLVAVGALTAVGRAARRSPAVAERV